MKTSFTLLFLFLVLQLMSQISIDREVITSFGTTTTNTSATLGEVIIGSNNEANIQLTSGFQQIEGNTSVNVIDLNGSQIEIKAFPNPFTDQFSISIDDPSKISQIQLIDIQGRSIYHKNVNSKDYLITIHQTDNLNSGLTGIVIQTKSNKRYLAGWIMKTQ